jgi:hypothetical protein
VLRAAVACEAVGVPSVSLVCEGFERQAAATGRGLGFDSMPLATLRGHVDSQSAADMLASLREHTVAQVVEGLTRVQGQQGQVDREPLAQEVVCSGSIDRINEVFLSRGWTDGNPIIPPTVERIETLIAEWGYDPWRVVGVAQPSGRDMTVWSIATNAVMAGCAPTHLPLLVAIAEILANPT